MSTLSETLSSSALSAAEYDTTDEVLTITFSNGSTATYSGVPQEIYDGLVRSASPGRYYWGNIRDRF